MLIKTAEELKSFSGGEESIIEEKIKGVVEVRVRYCVVIRTRGRQRDIQTDRWMDGDRWTDRETKRWTNGQRDRWMDRQTNGQTDRQRDRQTERRIDGRADRQRDRHTHTQKRRIEMAHTHTHTHTLVITIVLIATGLSIIVRL